MTTKEKVLVLFEENRGTYYSGERIAEELSVSRTSVWKAVKALQSEGYAIHAVTNRGYCLSEEADILSVRGVTKYLDASCGFLRLQVAASVPSTNTSVRELAVSGEPEGLVLIAEEQTGGRGRAGRSFYSPKDTGIYLSILLRPEQASPQEGVKLTTKAAVAMCRALEQVSDKKAEIKWVNDLFVEGKKVCGILTEGAFHMEDGMMEYAVLGLGVNLYPPEGGFPEELKDIAGSLFSEGVNFDIKNRLCAAFLNEFMKLYLHDKADTYVEEYRKRCFVIGKTVTVLSGQKQEEALVTGIDDACHLLVRWKDGREEALSSGEIRIRP
ncbi:MAG: biotin--[acetyl-CoA-carboxylase] ligase [Lachnospiraceae bacterium]|nr:biotin--[acetyl-CoA-carboxylase] ligase [Lachnospiraceae bacterium]